MAPAIVPITTRGYPHFVVVRGRAGDKLLIADPAFGNRTMDVDAFESAWTQNIGFVVRRRDGLGSAQPADAKFHRCPAAIRCRGA